MIKVNNLSRSYGPLEAVSQVSFALHPGEIVGLLGHNGAGKTTIMKMLTGYLEPTSGSIEIDGQPLDRDSIELRGRLGYLPESPPLYPDLTVFDYLAFTAGMRGIASAQTDAAVLRSLQQTDLTDRAASRIATLSRGYRQRVGVAQALLGQPSLLVLDEPTNGLDPTQIEHMRKLIRSFHGQTTVILSTHIMQEVSAMCDRVLMIRNGRLALDSSLASLRHADTLFLASSAGAERLDAVLRPLNLQVEALGEGRYRLSLAKTSVPGRSASSPPAAEETDKSESLAPSTHSADEHRVGRIARALLEAGIPFSALHPETRDLEAIFRDINHPRNLDHAA